jgi:hypothetical protein
VSTRSMRLFGFRRKASAPARDASSLMSSREMSTTGVLPPVRLSARSLGQCEPREAAQFVVNKEQVEVLLALDVGDGVALVRAGLDVPPGELKHVADGL